MYILLMQFPHLERISNDLLWDMVEERRWIKKKRKAFTYFWSMNAIWLSYCPITLAIVVEMFLLCFSFQFNWNNCKKHWQSLDMRSHMSAYIHVHVKCDTLTGHVALLASVPRLTNLLIHILAHFIYNNITDIL